MSSLFADPRAELLQRPLAERMRPRSLSEVAGQERAVELLAELLSRQRLPSLILWGPPGCGKTSIARLLAGERYYFHPLSAVLAGVKDVREAIEAARRRSKLGEQPTLLFIDEIHRFNKSQQDALLPSVEDGTVVLVGATTENPSFEVIGPLMSRCRVVVLDGLDSSDIVELLQRALDDRERGALAGLPAELAVELEDGVLQQMAKLAAGDARFALSTLEVCVGLGLAAEEGQAVDSRADGSARQASVGRTAVSAKPAAQLEHYRHRLPHFRLQGSVYFVTWRINPSQRPLDARARGIVQEALLHFKDQRYRLPAHVVMDDHVHVLVQPVADQTLEETVRRWKSFTAHRLQRECGYQGSVWQDEYMDRIVRSDEELQQKAEYILSNPQKRWPELTDYEFSGWDFERFGELSGEEMADTAVRPTETPGPVNETLRPLNPGERLLRITSDTLARALSSRALLHDKSGEGHYNVISALHKSVRGSDPDSALYWLARMLEAGEDPKYVVRRMIRMASEDIGLADPWALVHAIAAKDAVDFLGMPECNNALAQLCVYLCCAPKSNAVYTAYSAARSLVQKHGALPVPLHIRNAPTQLMKDLGYSADYKYAHSYEGGFVADNYWPEELAAEPPRVLELTGRGSEKSLLERLRRWWGGRYEAADEREG